MLKFSLILNYQKLDKSKEALNIYKQLNSSSFDVKKNKAYCLKSLYKYKGVQWFNNTIMICAGSTSGIRYNAARGDSGGPLIVMNDNHTYLVGVVSWGDPNDPGFQKAHPAVYARVSAVENWIFSTITTYDEKPRPDLTRC